MIKHVLVLGDSHATVFQHDTFAKAFPECSFSVTTIAGATVSGLQNPNSATQAYPRLMHSAEESTADTTIVLLGEVDVGFVIWYRAEKYGVPVAEMLELALSNYGALLDTLAKKSAVVCISTPLPTLMDGAEWGDVANARRHVKATRLDRTRLTLQFNRRMQQFCESRAFGYLSLDDECLGDDGLLRPCFLNPSPADHHYNADLYAAVLSKKMAERLLLS